MRQRLQRASILSSVRSVPDWFVDPGPLDTEEIFCCQCRVDGSIRADIYADMTHDTDKHQQDKRVTQ